TPAGRVNSTNGKRSTTASAATSKVVASRVRMATNGSARSEIWLPNRLIVFADHSRRKSPLRQSGPRGFSRASNRLCGGRLVGECFHGRFLSSICFLLVHRPISRAVAAAHQDLRPLPTAPLSAALGGA